MCSIKSAVRIHYLNFTQGSIYTLDYCFYFHPTNWLCVESFISASFLMEPFPSLFVYPKKTNRVKTGCGNNRLGNIKRKVVPRTNVDIMKASNYVSPVLSTVFRIDSGSRTKLLNWQKMLLCVCVFSGCKWAYASKNISFALSRIQILLTVRDFEKSLWKRRISTRMPSQRALFLKEKRQKSNKCISYRIQHSQIYPVGQ